MRTGAIAWVAAIGIATICWSCGRGPQQGPGTMPNELGLQKPAITDAQILADIKRQFAADPVLAREKIQISVQDKRVSLVGCVSSGEVRIKAEDKVRAHPQVLGLNSEKLLVK